MPTGSPGRLDRLHTANKEAARQIAIFFTLRPRTKSTKRAAKHACARRCAPAPEFARRSSHSNTLVLDREHLTARAKFCDTDCHAGHDSVSNFLRVAASTHEPSQQLFSMRSYPIACHMACSFIAYTVSPGVHTLVVKSWSRSCRRL